MARRTVRVFATSSSLQSGCGFWRNFCLTSLFKYSSGLCSGALARHRSPRREARRTFEDEIRHDLALLLAKHEATAIRIVQRQPARRVLQSETRRTTLSPVRLQLSRIADLDLQPPDSGLDMESTVTGNSRVWWHLAR